MEQSRPPQQQQERRQRDEDQQKATDEHDAILAAATLGAKATSNDEAEILWEGYLLKQGSRAKQFWHERYFVLRADHSLCYYRRKEDAVPKRTYNLSRLMECEVSELFVEQYHKEMIYCLRLTWSPPPDQSQNSQQSGQIDDASSIGTGFAGDETEPPLPPPPPTTSTRINSTRRLISRTRSATNNNTTIANQNNNNVAVPSIEESDLTFGTRARPPAPNNNNYKNNNKSTVTGGKTDIPALVEVDSRFAVLSNNNSNNNNKGSKANAGSSNALVNRTRTPYEEEEEEELEYLRNEYYVKKRKNGQNKKMALATGAAVGVLGATVATAGIALVTGLVFLGVGAAAGGTAWRKKQDGEIVVATSNYEHAKLLKSCLDASLESHVVQQSKWGQLFVASNDSYRNRSNYFVDDGRRKTRLALMPKSKGGPIDTITSSKSFTWLSSTTKNNTGGVTQTNNGTSGGSGELVKLRTVRFESSTNWRPMEGGGWANLLGTGVHSLRIFREERADEFSYCSNNNNKDGNNTLFSLTERMRRFFFLDGAINQDSQSPGMLKAHTVLSTSPLDAFLCLMSYGRHIPHDKEPSHAHSRCFSPNSEQRMSFRVVETIDDNADVIHLVFQPLYLFPSWTCPRDFCLYRYWRLEQDGSYIICYESVRHPECPTLPGHVRGEMHQVYTIAPHKKMHRRRTASARVNPDECFMTAVVQVDPKGWVPTVNPLPHFLSRHQPYGDAFGVAALLHLLDLRDAIDQDRFVPVALDSDAVQLFPTNNATANRLLSTTASSPLSNEGVGIHAATTTVGNANNNTNSNNAVEADFLNYDFAFAASESRHDIAGMADDKTAGTVTPYFVRTPPPLSPEKWAEPDSNSFRVRGKMYKMDKLKYNAGPSIGRLVAVDVVEVEQPIYSGFSLHPSERVQLALKREEEARRKSGGLASKHHDAPAFVFVVNIVLPGPPYYHGVFYYVVDDVSTIDGSDGTPSSRLCREFFFGESDEFRDRTFKLIPQIVQGNFIVRKAVGSTPAIIGRKLRQFYVRHDRFFEVVLDCGSSPVATGVIRLSLGYARTLVVDMGFLLEGNDESTLPERIFGCVRIKQLEFGRGLRFVKAPPGTTTADNQ